jgi:hypothetical protein
MCWPRHRANDVTPLPWMEGVLNVEIPTCDKDTKIEEDKYEAPCMGPPTHSWPLPGKTLLSKRKLNLQKKRVFLRLERLKSQFPKFSELPSEIRWKIWNLSTLAVPSSPRVIGFVADSDNHVRAFAKIPTLLHASHETREEALKDYKLCFSEICAGKPVYINFKIDRIYMYTAETFRRFFLDNPISNIACHIESRLLFNEARYLFINCSSPSLPELPAHSRFRSLKLLVLPKWKYGNNQLARDWPCEVRMWTSVRKEEIKRNFRPENGEAASEFEIVLTRDFSTFDPYFKNMVITPSSSLFYGLADRNRYKKLIEQLAD